eukprot:TRINITY_DN7454_c0_g1_i1.p1 TRINITY_DN7454_c0_g1~~TRINITY_DN7454_c0_g1_i1.p1  ORF type:complete len:472 (+),score=169.25 TRINITY_DN7454_c0_g1_i1:130-1545(+)
MEPLPALCVRGRQLLGGSQKLSGLDVPRDVDDLILALRKRLVTNTDAEAAIDYLRYYDAEVEEWVLLVDVGVLTATDEPKLIEVGTRAPRQRADRVEYLALAFAQAVRSVAHAHTLPKTQHCDPSVDDGPAAAMRPVWGDGSSSALSSPPHPPALPPAEDAGAAAARMLRSFETITPLADPFAIFPEADAYGIVSAIERVALAGEHRQEEVLVAHLIDSLRTLVSSFADRPGDCTASAVEKGGDDDAASSSSSSSSAEAPRAYSIYARMGGAGTAKGLKVVILDGGDPAPFEFVTHAFEAKFGVPTGQLAFKFEDAEGFQWAVDDDASLRTFLSGYTEDDRPPLMCTAHQPLVVAQAAATPPRQTYCCVAAPNEATRFTEDAAHRREWDRYLRHYGCEPDDATAALPPEAVHALLRRDAAYGWLLEDDPSLFPKYLRSVKSVMSKSQSGPAAEQRVTFQDFSMLLLRLSQV